MDRVPVTVTIIAKNEAHQIARSILSARWADEVLVVDSGSSDGTAQVARESGATVLENAWTGYGQQKNFAQDRARNDWIVNIDADEVLTPELVEEIQDWISKQNTLLQAGGTPGRLAIPRKTFYRGQWVRFGGWYPNRVARVGHRKFSRWTEPNLHENLAGSGPLARASHPMEHYTFDSIADQVATNLKYALAGSRELKRRGQCFSMLRLLLKPLSKFFETYFWKLGFLDGTLGFIISINAAHSMFLKQAFLSEKDGENS